MTSPRPLRNRQRAPEPPAGSEQLRRWIPHLLNTWRNQFGFPAGPADRLLPHELDLVTRGLTRMSQGLTRERTLAGKNYFSDPGQLGAYLLFFWPVSYVQARQVLKRLQPIPRTILDLGSGAGPLGAAGLDSGAAQVTYADRSAFNLKLARELARSHGRTAKTHLWDLQTPAGSLPGKFDLIGLEHVLNELWTGTANALPRREALLAQLRSKLNPHGRLVLIEPALTATSRELIHLRDGLIAKGWRLQLPCLWPKACPALHKSTDSCHFEWDWDPPALVRSLIHRAGLKKKQIKMTYFVLSPHESAGSPRPAGETLLIVSEPLRSKNRRLRLIGCGPAGRVPLALHPRDQSPANRLFPGLRRGDLIRLLQAEKSGNGFRLTPATQVQIIQRA